MAVPVAFLAGEGSALDEAQEHESVPAASCAAFALADAHFRAVHFLDAPAEPATEGCTADDCSPAVPAEAEPAAVAVAPVDCTQDGYFQAAPADFLPAAMAAVVAEKSRDDCSPAVFLGIDAAAAPDFADWRMAAAEHCGCCIAVRRDGLSCQAH